MSKMSVYSLRKIRDLDGMHSGNYVLIRGRIINLYYDAVYQRAYLTVADDSGMILAKVQNAASQTIFTGAVVSVRGELAVHEGKIYLKTKEISKMQTVEDEYSNLVNVTLIEESELPDFEGKKWVKPSSWNNKKIVTLRSVSLEEGVKLGRVGFGVGLFLIALLMPLIVGVFMLIAGVSLIFLGIINKETDIKAYETLQQHS